MRDDTSRWLPLAIALAILIAAPPVFAQDGGESDLPPEVLEATKNAEKKDAAEEAKKSDEAEKSDDEAPADGKKKGEKKKGDEKASAEGDKTNEEVDPITRDPDDPLYWSDMRGIYTVQKRSFQKDGRFGATIYGGLIPNNIFTHYYPVGLRLDYFILENLGVELAGAYAFRNQTGLKALIQEEGGVEAQQILVGDTQLVHSNFGVVWSPFYGKTAFYTSALNYFDFYLFAGVGLTVTETPPTFNADPVAEVKAEGAMGAGLAYYLGTHAALRIDFRQFIFPKVAGAGGGVAKPSEVSLGLAYFL